MMKIVIKSDFSEFPTLRHCNISEKSGEEFYHTILNNMFKESLDKNEILEVDLDDTEGYAPSFIDESFGNLVYDFGLETVQNHLKVISEEEPYWLTKLSKETYPQWESRRINNEIPKKTKKHDAWYRLIDGDLVSKVWVEKSRDK